jgi:hypothetical protein
MVRRPAVEPALSTHAQRALCTILVAATIAACSPLSPRSAASPSPRVATATPDLTRGIGSPHSMGFYPSTCLFDGNPGELCYNVIFGIGPITEHTDADAVAFTHALDAALPGGLRGRGNGEWVIVLDSDGGNVGAALTWGRDIRQAHWNTMTGIPYPLAAQWRTATCASACVYAFAGGVKRGIFTDGALAVHQFTNASPKITVAAVQYTTAVITAYLVEMGVSGDLQAIAGLTPSTTVFPLTMYQAVTIGLATNRG